MQETSIEKLSTLLITVVGPGLPTCCAICVPILYKNPDLLEINHSSLIFIRVSYLHYKGTNGPEVVYVVFILSRVIL